MKKICKIYLPFFLFITLTGCSSIHNWKYSAEPMLFQKPKSDKSLIVPPLRDARSKDGKSIAVLALLIPLVPYVKAFELNVPDGSTTNMKPTEDFSKAVAEELSSSAIFKDVYFSYKTADADYILHGTLNKSQIKVYETWYGLSVAGVLLSFLGIPTTNTYNYIDIDFKLIDKDFNTCFERKYTAETNWYAGLYYNLFEKTRFEELLKSINKQVVADVSNVDFSTCTQTPVKLAPYSIW